MSFTIFQNEKTPFQAIKKRISKSLTIDIFPKGLTLGFGLKTTIFPTFFFLGNIGQENVFYDILEQKNAFLGYKNKKFKKSKNQLFLIRVNPWFQSQNGHFSNFFFQAIFARKMSFMIFQNEQTPFQAIKTKRSKSRKIENFPKGLTHFFGPKMAIFPTFFFLGNIGQENVFYDILERKNAFLGYKKRSSKSRKIAIFPKVLTHGFGPKMAVYRTSFFQSKQARKMSITTLQNKKTPFQAIKKEV